MQVVLEILVRVAEILTIIAGSTGVCLSLVMIVSPALIRKANQALNQQMMTNSQMATFNPTIDLEPFAQRHHVVCGGTLVAGSIFILLFLFMRAAVPEGFGLFTDMALEFSILLGKTAGFLGLAAGTLLFFFPTAFRSLARRTNIWIDTQPVFDKLDTVRVDVDSVIIRYAWVFGLVGLVVSIGLIIISVANFLGTSASLGGRL